MKLNRLSVAICVSLAVPVLLGACAASKAAPAPTAAPVAMVKKVDVTYRKDVAPMIKKYCAECHADAAGSPSMADFKLDEERYAKKEKVGPRTDTYEHLLQLVNGMSTGAFMRRLDDGTSPYAGGKPGNMYKYLCEKENTNNNADCVANLKILKEWVGEGGWNLNRMAARGDVPALTKEQMDKLKLKY